MKAYGKNFLIKLISSTKNSWQSPSASLQFLPQAENALTSPWLQVAKFIGKHPVLHLFWKINLAAYRIYLKLTQCLWGDLVNHSKQARRMDTALKKTAIKYANRLSFLKALIINPRATGAAFPSSKQLAKEMALHVPLEVTGLVIELGAGTGVVTEALLKRGIHPARIIAVEELCKI